MPALIMAIILGLTTAVGGGAVYASQDALPDGALYPVKQMVESLQTATASSPESKAAAHLSIAETKLKEVDKLDARQAAAQHLAAAADRLAEHQTAAAAALAEAKGKGKDVNALVAKLEANAQRHQAVLQRVLDKAPDQAKAAIRHAMEASQHGLQNAMERQSERQKTRSEAAKTSDEQNATGRPSLDDKSAKPERGEGLAVGGQQRGGRPTNSPSGR